MSNLAGSSTHFCQAKRRITTAVARRSLYEKPRFASPATILTSLRVRACAPTFFRYPQQPAVDGEPSVLRHLQGSFRHLAVICAFSLNSCAPTLADGMHNGLERSKHHVVSVKSSPNAHRCPICGRVLVPMEYLGQAPH